MKSLLQTTLFAVLVSTSTVLQADEAILADTVMPGSEIDLQINRPLPPAGPSMNRCEVWVRMQLPGNQEPNLENIRVIELKGDPQKEQIAKAEFLQAIQTDNYAHPRLTHSILIKGDEQTGYETFRRDAHYYEVCS